MSKRKVVISATCHGDVIRQLLAKSAAYVANFETVFVPNYQVTATGFPRAPVENLIPELHDCDVLMYHNIQAYQFEELFKMLRPGNVVFKLPYVTSKIYWPSNDMVPVWLAKYGPTAYIPFPCTVLNKMLDADSHIDAVARQYINLDLKSTINFDAVYTGQIDYLRIIQQDTVFDLVGYTEENFRSRQLFHLIHHPSVLYFEMFAHRILQVLGIEEQVTLGMDPFVGHQTPVHPSVIDFYGFSWCTEKTVYRMMDKNMTFEEYVDLYCHAYVESKQS